jgi:hypothetical protein
MLNEMKHLEYEKNWQRYVKKIRDPDTSASPQDDIKRTLRPALEQSEGMTQTCHFRHFQF